MIKNGKTRTAKRQQTPCYCLKARRAAAAITEYYDSVLAPSKITVSQFSLIKNILFSDNPSIRELADLVELDRSTLARGLKPLIRDNLVTDVRPRGQRNCQLSLTDKGRETFTRAKLLWAEAQKNLALKFGREGLRALELVLSAAGDL
jgi:DNA-binding MarR family transcriptional regulator